MDGTQPCPTRVLHNLSPYSKPFDVDPDYSLLRVFGSACFPLLRPYNALYQTKNIVSCQLKFVNNMIIYSPYGDIYSIKSKKAHKMTFNYSLVLSIL